jgi:vibriolysin
MKRIRNVVGLVSIAALAACADGPTDPDIRVNVGKPGTEADPAAQVVEAEIQQAAPDGVTQAISGDLGRVSADHVSDAELASALSSLGPLFQVTPSKLRLERVTEDDLGNKHFRFSQVEGDQDVVGGDLMVHVDGKGAIYSVNGTTRSFAVKNVANARASLSRGISQVHALEGYATAAVRVNRTAYVIGSDDQVHLAYEAVAEGFRGADPFVDYVYTDVDSGAKIAVRPKIHFGKAWNTHDLAHGTSLPGPLVKVNGVTQPGKTADAQVTQADDATSYVYDTYKTLFDRDSIDNAGMTMVSSVHYSSNYVNAFWNGSQMTYGDGDGTNAGPLTTLDIGAHEITHGVTERESNLVYSGESGGINESMSDIAGAFVEAYRDGGANENTWKMGEECWTPGTAGDALRYMNDPAKDGRSLDFWSSSAGGVDVHYNSGIGNLAFYLLSQGGKHPRGKSPIEVSGIGITKAAQIFYDANTNCLTSGSRYAALATCAKTVATARFGAGSPEVAAVEQAFGAVNLAPQPPPPPSPTPGSLENNVPKANISGAQGNQQIWSVTVPAGAKNLVITTTGGEGDVDVYVKFGATPTPTVNDCKSEGAATTETCTFATTSAGTYQILLSAYSDYQGVTLTAKYEGGTEPPPSGDTISNNVPKTGLTLAKNAWIYFQFTVPAGKTPTVILDAMASRKGDPDLYVRFGSKPTATAYDCRPYLGGTSKETCTVNKGAGVYYIGIKAFSAVTTPGATVTAKW